MGSVDHLSYPGDGEGPLREIELTAFAIDACAVSNADFAAFVESTGYRTESELIGWSFVFAGLLPDDFPPTQGAADAPWWRAVESASWRHPEGPDTGIEERLDHPVVHVSWNDAVAYAEWAGKSLPSEAQWERAARGGLESQPYPWGDELTPGGEHRMNVWQGVFPTENGNEDGWYATCPVDEYRSQWARSIQHDRQRLGVVPRLVRCLSRSNAANQSRWTAGRRSEGAQGRQFSLP